MRLSLILPHLGELAPSFGTYPSTINVGSRASMGTYKPSSIYMTQPAVGSRRLAKVVVFNAESK